MNKPIDWRIAATDGRARAGVLQTRRSVIETPVFMPVGTQAAIKSVRFEALEDEIDARIILANTYHLFLRPGADVVRAAGGLHGFTTWARSFLTDSGGFQVFSLGALRKIGEDGVRFRSHLDGSEHFLSPEISMEIQAALGSEIVMAFDECPPGGTAHDPAKKSLEMTARWAERSKRRFDELQNTVGDTAREAAATASATTGDAGSVQLSGEQALFGIVQGAVHKDLRTESLDRTVAIGFDGYAIGGLSVGEEKSLMYDVIEHTAPAMPFDQPRYLMGVGTPEDLLRAVGFGVDMFDCVLPTRNGRTGAAFTSAGKLNIRNARFISDDQPIDGDCPCSVCRRYSRGYVRHLYQAGEMTAATLLSHHNIAFFVELMRRARAAIIENIFEQFKSETLEKMAAGPE